MRGLAAEVVDRVLAEGSEPGESWDTGPWQAAARRGREVLCPPGGGEQLGLF